MRTPTTAGGRLAWYVARTRAMSPAELAWRASTRVSGVVGRRRAVPVLPAHDTWVEAFRRFRAAEDRPVLLSAGRAAQLAAAMPASVAEVVAAADAVLERRFAFFGQQPVTFPGTEVDWNLDPRTGLSWPLAPAGDIDHRSHRGDPKWIWELNRLQHLPWLAQAWLLTGEVRYADAALEQLDSWIRQNPFGRGIAWRGGFEAALRSISVAVALQGLRESPGMNVERYRRVVTLLALSAGYAWRCRSLFSSANNHLLGELAGVATVALLHPELAGSATASTRALQLLGDEAGRQILPDGAGAEQSTAYQIFASELLVVPVALLRLRGAQPPKALIEALSRSVRYLQALGRPLPRYGDEDGGFALRLHADPAPGLDRLQAAVSTVIAGFPAGSTDLAAAWLARPDAEPGPAACEPVLGDLHARDGGLVVLRRGDRRFTMDVGPLGYLAIAAHGHADALSVTLSASDQVVIGDPGTGSYYAEPAWRNAFRGTRMHPTVAVDDLDQSVAGGAFLWIRHARMTVRAVDPQAGVVEAEHDGYARLEKPVMHRRYLVARPDSTTVAVVDLLTGSDTHRVRTSWPLHPDLTAEYVDGAHVVRDPSGKTLVQISCAATVPGEPWALHGDAGQRLGWWSHRFESRTPAWLVGTVVERAELPLAVLTLLTEDTVSDLEVRWRGHLIEARWSEGSRPAALRIDTRIPGAVECAVGSS